MSLLRREDSVPDYGSKICDDDEYIVIHVQAVTNVLRRFCKENLDTDL